MLNELHWLPLHARIQFKILSLIFKAQRGLAPQYLIGVILRPHSASSHRPLRSCNRLDLLVPRSRTAMAQARSFASIGPSPVSYTHLRAHETPEHLVCRLLLEKKKKKKIRMTHI